jgi:hypothetical protein
MELQFTDNDALLEFLLLERGLYGLSPEQYWIAREEEQDEDDPIINLGANNEHP